MLAFYVMLVCCVAMCDSLVLFVIYARCLMRCVCARMRAVQLLCDCCSVIMCADVLCVFVYFVVINCNVSVAVAMVAPLI